MGALYSAWYCLGATTMNFVAARHLMKGGGVVLSYASYHLQGMSQQPPRAIYFCEALTPFMYPRPESLILVRVSSFSFWNFSMDAFCSALHRSMLAGEHAGLRFSSANFLR